MKCVLHKDSELTAYLAHCKNYNKSTGLDFWLSEAAKYPLLAPLAQDLLSAPALRHMWSVYFQYVVT